MMKVGKSNEYRSVVRILPIPHVLSILLLSVSFLSYAQKSVPELWGQRVHDDAHVLKQETVESLEKMLKDYEDSTSNQIAILTVTSLEGEVLEEYALKVAEKWKLGQKEKDNGVLLLIAVDDHEMRIEVGHGLEGVLTDAMCNRIIRNEMAPNFRRGDFDAGVLAAITGITKAIGGEYISEDTSGVDFARDWPTRLFIGIFVFSILGVFTMIALLSEGCAGWFMYFFLLPFYAAFPWIVLGPANAKTLFGVYALGLPIARMIVPRTKWGKQQMKKFKSGNRGKSGRGWGSSGGWSGSSGGGGFSGGGGSFGGGGSSGSW